ncbi:TBC1 domain family member 22A [Carlito syrichta]|uniref:TBC1 domain family member 22A n=1 Tax=Carlito syrichta TaxID=1868482 RepID=A0A1U7SLJ3_CARSF|nr:TBC1 domain family member 22A [Carlito syrichta]
MIIRIFASWNDTSRNFSELHAFLHSDSNSAEGLRQGVKDLELRLLCCHPWQLYEKARACDWCECELVLWGMMLEQVHRHLDQHEVRYLQFAFRWMNNLLMREVPLRCTIRLWDTYQSEPEGFSHFHLYVCAAFLVRWRKEILEERDFQELLLFLQNLPTAHWDNEDISLLLAEAYRLKFAFADAPNHYKK